MSCHDLMLMLSAYIDGEARSDEAREVKVHLAACPECALELDLLARTAAAVSSAPEIEPPAGLLARIEAATVARPKRTPVLSALWARPRHLGYGAASVAAIGALTITICVLPSVHRMTRGVPTISGGRTVSMAVTTAREVAPHPRVRPSDAADAGRPAVGGPDERTGRLVFRWSDGSSRTRSRHRRTVGESHAPVAAHPSAPMVAAKPGSTEPALIDVKSQAKSVVTPIVTAVEKSEESEREKSTVVAEPVKPAAGPITIARAGVDEQRVVRLPQSSALSAQLRAAIAARNREKRFATYSDDPASRAISVELASIRF